MQVSVEATGNSERKMTVKIPDAELGDKITRRLTQLSKTVRMKGFRPGKIPLKVMKQHFGAQVREELADALIKEKLGEAFQQINLYPINQPVLSASQERDGAFEFVIDFQIMPEISAAPFDGVELDAEEADVTDVDLEQMLETLRGQRANWVEISEAAAEGDRLTIDYHGTIDGEDFSGNRGSNVVVTLGGKRMIAGFEEGLIGATAGTELTLALRFPDDYGHTEVAGKDVVFAVTVKKVERPQLPELNEDFAKAFGIEDGSLEGLRNEVRNNMKLELKHRLRNNLKMRVLDKLLELNQFDVPQSLVERESANMLEQMKERIQNPKGKTLNLSPSMYTEEATRRVKLGMLVNAIIREQKIELNQEMVELRLQEIAQSYEAPDEVIEWHKSDRQHMAGIESVVMEDQVIDWILSQIKLNSVQSSFQEIVSAH
jgi:trigger factor